MFEELSISSLDDLFTHIPETLKLNDGLNVPATLSELESIAHFESVESKKYTKFNLLCWWWTLRRVFTSYCKNTNYET